MSGCTPGRICRSCQECVPGPRQDAGEGDHEQVSHKLHQALLQTQLTEVGQGQSCRKKQAWRGSQNRYQPLLQLALAAGLWASHTAPQNRSLFFCTKLFMVPLLAAVKRQSDLETTLGNS